MLNGRSSMTKVQSPSDRRRWVTMCAVALTAVACVGAGLAAPADADDVAVGRGATRLAAHLTGAQEEPGPGDPNGTGNVVIRLRPGAGKVCARATWSRIATPDAAHIHKGRRGVAGDVVVDLTGSVTGGRHCATAPPRLIRRIADHPRAYYFNIHNPRYPAGAIRGQLHARR
jgi:hypothetical protein